MNGAAEAKGVIDSVNRTAVVAPEKIALNGLPRARGGRSRAEYDPNLHVEGRGGSITEASRSGLMAFTIF